MEGTVVETRKKVEGGVTLILRTPGGEQMWLKIVNSIGSVMNAPIDGSTAHIELKRHREQGNIVVSLLCPGGKMCKACGKRPRQCQCDTSDLIEVCHISGKPQLECDHPHPIPSDYRWPEHEQYPLGLNDPKLKAEIARRQKAQLDERMSHAAAQPEVVAQRAAAHAAAQIIGGTSSAQAAQTAEVTALKAENAELRADLKEMKGQLAALVEGLGGKKK